jgi:hypothetical protein
MATTVVGMFDSFEAAHAALDELAANGIPEEDLGVVHSGEQHGRREHASRTGAGVAAGAGTGAVAGGAAGLIASLAGVVLPGFGPMVAAGWLAATLAGAGFGAAAGGLVGALLASGIPEHEAHVYEEGLRRGKSLVTARCDDVRAPQVATVLERHGALDVEETAKDFERGGWTRPVARSEPAERSGPRSRVFEDYVAREEARERSSARSPDLEVGPLAAGRAADEDEDTPRRAPRDEDLPGERERRER